MIVTTEPSFKVIVVIVGATLLLLTQQLTVVVVVSLSTPWQQRMMIQPLVVINHNNNNMNKNDHTSSLSYNNKKHHYHHGMKYNIYYYTTTTSMFSRRRRTLLSSSSSSTPITVYGSSTISPSTSIQQQEQHQQHQHVQSPPIILPKHIAFICDGNRRWSDNHMNQNIHYEKIDHHDNQSPLPTQLSSNGIPTSTVSTLVTDHPNNTMTCNNNNNKNPNHRYDGHVMGANRTLEIIQYLLQYQYPQNVYNYKSNANNDNISSNSSSSISTTQEGKHYITHVTFYAFSSENWNRSTMEVIALMKLFEAITKQWYNTFIVENGNHNNHNIDLNHNTRRNTRRNIIFKVIGHLDDVRIPNSLRTALRQLETSTQQQYVTATINTNTNHVTIPNSTTTPTTTNPIPPPLTVCIAINYGGRQDIVQATQKILFQYIMDRQLLQQQQQFKLSSSTSSTVPQQQQQLLQKDIHEYITEATFAQFLDMSSSSATAGCMTNQMNTDYNNNIRRPYEDSTIIPDPDLLIRTSGEQRISNFLLWNIAYTELYFTNTFWPDFTIEELQTAIIWYTQRQRRYGASSTTTGTLS